MSNAKKINALVIVEGAKGEKPLLENLASKFGMPLDIYVYGTNIYDLFQRLKRDRDANGGARVLNIKDVLAERTNDSSQRAILNQDFAFTYLVYDCDIQHHGPGNAQCSIDALCNENVAILRQMLDQFTDETDGTIGRLYINYPMNEAWRDADNFFDEAYKSAGITIDSVKEYKEHTSMHRLAGFGCGLTRTQFLDVIRMMLCKLHYLHTGDWKMPGYDGYLKQSRSISILDIEEKLMQCSRYISALNTSMFLPIDYFGNGVYSEISGTKE